MGNGDIYSWGHSSFVGGANGAHHNATNMGEKLMTLKIFGARLSPPPRTPVARRLWLNVTYKQSQKAWKLQKVPYSVQKFHEL